MESKLCIVAEPSRRTILGLPALSECTVGGFGTPPRGMADYSQRIGVEAPSWGAAG